MVNPHGFAIFFVYQKVNESISLNAQIDNQAVSVF